MLQRQKQKRRHLLQISQDVDAGRRSARVSVPVTLETIAFSSPRHKTIRRSALDFLITVRFWNGSMSYELLLAFRWGSGPKCWRGGGGGCAGGWESRAGLPGAEELSYVTWATGGPGLGIWHKVIKTQTYLLRPSFFPSTGPVSLRAQNIFISVSQKLMFVLQLMLVLIINHK